MKATACETRLILASQSKIRKRAIDILGLFCECIPASIDEKAIRHPDPLKMAVMISEAKAIAVSQKEEGIIIASDTFLVLEGKILEKPASLEEAHTMLRELSGRGYTLVSGLAVYDTFTGKMRSTVATCNVYFRHLTEAEILDYCQRFPVLSYAGAHATEGVIRFSERIEGCNMTETAMPVKDLILFLREAGSDRGEQIVK